MFKFSFNITVCVAQFHCVGATGNTGKGDDVYLLHIRVHHGAVDKTAHAVVNRNIHIAEALVEVDINGIVVCASDNGVVASI